MDVSLWIWLALVAFIGVLLVLDLFVFHRDPHRVGFKEAALFSAMWVVIGVVFGVGVLVFGGAQAGGEYFAGYLLEKALSVDNLFVFALIFAYFNVPAEYQHRVLFWGVASALVLRAIFIFAGAELLEASHLIVYVFGALLIFTGVRMALHKGDQEVDPERNPILKLVRRRVPMTDGWRGPRFVVREHGKWVATPLLAVLVVVETTDVVFATDSIPAIFAITTDTFIVFASNAFALLGLRALYFLLAGALDRFVYLQMGLAAVLVFVGGKFIYGELFGKVPITVSLPVIALLVGGSIGASLWRTRGQEPAPEPLRIPA